MADGVIAALRYETAATLPRTALSHTGAATGTFAAVLALRP